jgi:hypothetical protein
MNNKQSEQKSATCTATLGVIRGVINLAATGARQQDVNCTAKQHDYLDRHRIKTVSKLINFFLTDQLTHERRALKSEESLSQKINSPIVYRTPMFITLFTTAIYWSLS